MNICVLDSIACILVFFSSSSKQGEMCIFQCIYHLEASGVSFIMPVSESTVHCQTFFEASEVSFIMPVSESTVHCQTFFVFVLVIVFFFFCESSLPFALI